MGPVVVDTQLLLLLVVGQAGLAYIERHKRLDGYTVADFELLSAVLNNMYDDIVVLPNVLTEVLSLAYQISDPARTRIIRRIQALATSANEVHVPSRSAAQHPSFLRLRLTDTALLMACDPVGAWRDWGLTLLTDDEDLAIQCEMARATVDRFQHWRIPPGTSR